jgi:hypothetical protein
MRRGGEVIAVGRRQWRSTESHRPDQWKAHARHVGQFAAVGPACELDRWGNAMQGCFMDQRGGGFFGMAITN